ncbi:MAG: diaminopimelate decarboxylase [Actinomycetota bacterium]|nr:diaminopimelate decarboxylase [Actinomycetota bacterium]
MSAIDLALLSDNATVERDGWLAVGGCRIDDLASTYATPLFIYDEAHLRARCREAVSAFGAGNAIYATKAFLCKAMARLAVEEGMLLDVASGGELGVALAAGVPASSCVLHGNNKGDDELHEALTSEVRAIVVDSFDELDRLEALGRRGLPVADVLIRVTPGVHAHTHHYIATGQDDSKFGFNLGNGDAERAVARVASSATTRLVGLHCHIGSNVFDAASFGRAAEVMATFSSRFDVQQLVLGGGLGVPYMHGEQAPSITEWAGVVLDTCAAAGVTAQVGAEPGRAIVAAAAITVYRVGTIKDIPGVRRYLSVDGGMSDNPRPVLYASGYEAFLPRAAGADRAGRFRVVGKHCESGDVLVQDARLPDDVMVGDLLATPVTGAYGHSMGSNYNKLCRPPVVFVADGRHRLVVRRETIDDLLATDVG